MAQKLNLRYKIQFILNQSVKSITFTDLLSASYAGAGYDPLAVKGLLMILSPNGILYKNEGYDTNDFSDPDVIGSTHTWAVEDIALPLDEDDYPIEGVYSVYYKVSVNLGLTLTETSNFSTTFFYDSPSPVISMESSCMNSVLTVIDNTVYDIQYNGETVSPNVLNRSSILKYPSSAGHPPGSIDNIVSTAASFVAGPNIWTKSFNDFLTTILSYIVQLWTDGQAQVEIIDTIYGSQEHYVQCDDCSCSLYSCFMQIEGRYNQAKLQDPSEAERLGFLMNELGFYWGLYQIALRCNQDTSIICTKVKAISQSENCTCPSPNSEKSIEVIPWASMTTIVGGDAQVWYSGADIPSPLLGTDGNYYLKYNGDVYKKTTGAWAVILSIVGAKGEDGQSAYSVLGSTWNVPDVAGQYHNTEPFALASFEIDNTPTPFIQNNKDTIKILADCYMFNKGVGNGATFSITVNSINLISWFSDHETQLSGTGLVKFEIDIMRQASKAFHIRGKVSSGSISGSSFDKHFDAYLNTLDAEADWLIQVWGNNTDATQTDGTYDTKFMLWNFQVLYLPAQIAQALPESPYAFDHETFIASADQTNFPVTALTLTSKYLVYVNGLLVSTGFDRSGNTVIFDVGLNENDVVVILN